jgi:hypothetical protein
MFVPVASRASKRNFARRNKTILGPRRQVETSLKFEDLSWKYHPKKSKNLNKTCIAKVMGPFRDSRAPSWLAGPRTDVPTESPSQARTWISNVIYRYGFFHGSRWDVIAHFVDIGGILNITFQNLGLTTQHTVKVLYLVTVLFSWSVTVIFCFRFLSERDDYIRIYGVSFRIICLEMRSVSLLTDFSNDIFIIKYSNVCIGKKTIFIIDTRLVYDMLKINRSA